MITVRIVLISACRIQGTDSQSMAPQLLIYSSSLEKRIVFTFPTVFVHV